MKAIPRRLLRDSVSIEAYTGNGAYGPIYSTAATVLCKASSMRQLVRNSEGAEVVSELTLYVHPDDAASFVPESRVTFATRVCTVLSAAPLARPGETVLVKVTCT